MIRRAGNVKQALQSLRSARWRSFLTMLGVIIGVVSVVTIVSLGEGVKQQIREQSEVRGADLITILPGQRVQRDDNGTITNLMTLLPDGSVFSEADYQAVRSITELDKLAPLARVSGRVTARSEQFTGQVVATSSDLPQILNQKVAYGSFFEKNEQDDDYAVIGSRVAEELFKENVPMGKSFQLRDRTFIVRGIFEEFPTAGPLPLGVDYSNTIFIPYEVGREMLSGNLQTQELLAKPKAGITTQQAVSAVRQKLLTEHGNQEDFTVLTPVETLQMASGILNLLTTLISAIAAISLIVGGIGIMNIMFVSVTERTSEIGIRKAVGATTRQILNQFLTEATILATVGGLIGVLLSIVINFLMRVFTDLQPVITLPVMGVAIGVSVIVGIIFGVAPALHAARKDPIEALRYE